MKKRRNEEEMRMREDEKNMERMDDVVGEMGRKIERMKRKERKENRLK